MRKILFVCTGNTCRSPMAQAIALELLRSRGLTDRYQVSSAGLSAWPGAPASPQAREALAMAGIELEGHRSSQLTVEQVRQADLILTMTAAQKRTLLQSYPEAEGKVFLLREYAEAGVSASSSEMARLTRRIREKQVRFQAEHGRAIARLEQERAELLKRLQQIEDELDSWQRRLDEELLPETRELRKVEEELSAYDIPDPYGQGQEVYSSCAAELRRVVTAALDRFHGEASR